jgi:hypothetical protein
LIVNCTLSETEIREAIRDYIAKSTGVSIFPADVRIQVKSKQNYKSEWEEAAFRAEFAASRNDGTW